MALWASLWHGASDIEPEHLIPYPRQQRERRWPAAWAVLAVLVLSLMALQLAGQNATAARSEPKYTQEQLVVRQTVMMKGLMEWLERVTGEKSPMTPLARQPDEAKDLEELREARAKDTEAARLYVAAKAERGQEVTPEDLELVRRTGKPADKAFADVYAKKDLAPERAAELARALPEDGTFSQRVARARALKTAGDRSAMEAIAPVWKSVAFVGILLYMLALGLTGATLWLIYLAGRASGNFKPRGHAAEPMTLGDADRFAFKGAMAIGTFMIVGQLVAPLLGIGQGLSPAVRIAVASTLGLLAVLAVYRLPIFGKRHSLADAGIGRASFGRNVLWGLAGYAANVPVLVVTALVGAFLARVLDQKPSHPASDLLQGNPTMLTFLGILVAAAIVAPFWEELVFRGTLFPALSRVLGGPAWGIVASSFLFAAIHPQGMALWLALGGIGAVSAGLAYQTGSLVPSIIMHGLHNATILAFSLVLF